MDENSHPFVILAECDVNRLSTRLLIVEETQFDGLNRDLSIRGAQRDHAKDFDEYTATRKSVFNLVIGQKEKMRNLNVLRFVDEIAEITNDDYPSALKPLGFMIFISQEGHQTLIAQNHISERTYHRWMEIIRRAGWGDLLSDARLRQAVSETIWQRVSGLPIDKSRKKVLHAIQAIVADIEPRSPQAIRRQASDAAGCVQGVRQRLRALTLLR
jgi:hypothetical protein